MKSNKKSKNGNGKRRLQKHKPQKQQKDERLLYRVSGEANVQIFSGVRNYATDKISYVVFMRLPQGLNDNITITQAIEDSIEEEYYKDFSPRTSTWENYVVQVTLAKAWPAVDFARASEADIDAEAWAHSEGMFYG